MLSSVVVVPTHQSPLSRSNAHKRLESAPKPVTVLDSGVGDLRDRLATARDHFRQVAPSVQAVGR